MPNYNQTLQTNNSSLEDILTQINNLPEAGSMAEDLDAELTTQEGLIQQLSTILDGKASGGGNGNIETCDVTVSFTYGDPVNVWISGTQLIGGNISPFTFVDNSDSPQSFSSPLTILNVVKNTPLTITGYGSYSIDTGSFDNLSGCELLYVGIAPGTFAVKITDTIASVTVSNRY